MKPVLFHPAAEAELQDAIAHSESRQAGLGTSFQSEVERIVDLIQQPPSSPCLGWPDRSRDVSPYFLGHPDRVGPKSVVTI